MGIKTATGKFDRRVSCFVQLERNKGRMLKLSPNHKSMSAGKSGKEGMNQGCIYAEKAEKQV